MVVITGYQHVAAEEGYFPEIESSQQNEDSSSVIGSFRQPRFILGVWKLNLNIRYI